jgi:ficolin
MAGFGSIPANYWLGLERIKGFTVIFSTELRIDMSYGTQLGWAKYSTFSLGPATDNYRLSIGSFTGNVDTDSLSYHNGLPWTSLDWDTDSCSCNCAQVYTGAWWYGACHNSNLNGQHCQ